MLKKLIKYIFILFFSYQSYGQEEKKDFYMTKGKGFEFHFLDDNYLLQLDFRGQFRTTFTHDEIPIMG